MFVKDVAHKIQPALPLRSRRQHSSQSISSKYFLPFLTLDRREAAWQFLHILEDKGRVPFAERTNPVTVRYQEHIYLPLGALVNGLQGLTLYMRYMLLILLVLYGIKSKRITLALLGCINLLLCNAEPLTIADMQGHLLMYVGYNLSPLPNYQPYFTRKKSPLLPH